jgi:DNA-3-methyladenine glycosylase I
VPLAKVLRSGYDSTIARRPESLTLDVRTERVAKQAAKTRCGWVPADKPDYAEYHDREWGVPVHDDRKLFEMLILEGAQAGLSWYTILRRREGYRKAFKNFDPAKVARMTDAQLEKVQARGDIIRNRLKVQATRTNARAFLAIQKEFGSFDAYVWQFVGGRPRINRPKSMKDVPARTAESDALAKDLKKRGMSFVGTTIMYAFMQAVGLVDDHLRDCFRAVR